MSTNRVSATLSKDDKDAIFQALATIREKLPFLIELSAAERRNLNRLGDKSLAFVSTALELAKQNPGFLPRDFDIEEMSDDFELYQSLGSILMSLRKLTEELEDTQDAAGGEAFTAGLQIYKYASTNGTVTSGLDDSVKALKQRFIKKRSKKTDQES